MSPRLLTTVTSKAFIWCDGLRISSTSQSEAPTIATSIEPCAFFAQCSKTRPAVCVLPLPRPPCRSHMFQGSFGNSIIAHLRCLSRVHPGELEGLGALVRSPEGQLLQAPSRRLWVH